MKLIIPKLIGNRRYTFEVEGENFFDCIMESQKLSFYDVEKCGLCSSELLSLRAYITKEDKYEYVKITCGKCKGSLTFGKSKQDKDTYFLRKTEDGKLDWQKFTGDPNGK